MLCGGSTQPIVWAKQNIQVYVYIYIYIHIYTAIHIYIYIYIYTHTSTYTYTYTCTYKYTYTYTHTYIYIYIYIERERYHHVLLNNNDNNTNNNHHHRRRRHHHNIYQLSKLVCLYCGASDGEHGRLSYRDSPRQDSLRLRSRGIPSSLRISPLMRFGLRSNPRDPRSLYHQLPYRDCF